VSQLVEIMLDLSLLLLADQEGFGVGVGLCFGVSKRGLTRR
jgi:hypothetical protein